MCGICCVITVGTDTGDVQWIDDKICESLRRRGPNHSEIVQKSLGSHNGLSCCINFSGHVLHLRGSLTPQPLQDQSGNILLWNGEIFGGINNLIERDWQYVLLLHLGSRLNSLKINKLFGKYSKVSEGSNDGDVLLASLKKCNENEELLSVMCTVQGPWSFIYWQENKKYLWFGRDFFGRRSLLLHLPTCRNDSFVITSIACRPLTRSSKHWMEVPATGIYYIDMKSYHDRTSIKPEIIQYPWLWMSTCEKVSSDFQSQIQELNNDLVKCQIQNDYQTNPEANTCETKITANKPIRQSVFKMKLIDTEKLRNVRISNMYLGSPEEFDGGMNSVTANISLVPPVGPFNGTLYSTLAKNIDGLQETETKADVSSLDRPSSSQSVTETAHAQTKSSNKKTLCTVPGIEGASPNMDMTQTISAAGDPDILLAATSNTLDLANKLINVLGIAVKKRVYNLPRCCHHKENYAMVALQDMPDSECDDDKMHREKDKEKETVMIGIDAHVAVLFSGGLDSIVVAALADRYVPENEAIDLLNVAFHQKAQTTQKKLRPQPAACKDPYMVPDRITGRHGLQELRTLCPKRQWNFIEVNVTMEELQEMRQLRVSDLVYPLQTVLDDSIGCAIWFAARGHGILYSKGTTETDGIPYTSRSKVVLVGMGADEQLAGYSRHRGRYNSEGLPGLVEEIEMEIQRISARNLGRDDRIISDHGRESRFPFLDEDVVSFLNSLPVNLKANLDLPRGIGEKYLLRVAARLLGLREACLLPKRAIQFGSRIAKLEKNKEKASDTCQRLLE